MQPNLARWQMMTIIVPYLDLDEPVSLGLLFSLLLYELFLSLSLMFVSSGELINELGAAACLETSDWLIPFNREGSLSVNQNKQKKNEQHFLKCYLCRSHSNYTTSCG